LARKENANKMKTKWIAKMFVNNWVKHIRRLLIISLKLRFLAFIYDYL